MIDEHSGELHDKSSSKDLPKLSRRGLLAGLLALPIAALDAGSANAQYIGFGPFRLHLPTGGGYGGGYSGGYRPRRPARHVGHHQSGGGGGRHASRRGRHGGSGGGDNGGGTSTKGATGLGKADY
ncbi:hypothetical protein MSC49_25400 [Methylosinus sp. C49]|uniref:hypothetical protein n=1 Tax=Methylosinus sp. C49 TaxID=2699395 RepID=UPI001366DFD8|nr:hypothetical protein [Methylosinus sp. C49]BBU62605.1 hypothetical protein MSC49_25400 [Methylosinus sp. C49]